MRDGGGRRGCEGEGDVKGEGGGGSSQTLQKCVMTTCIYIYACYMIPL